MAEPLAAAVHAVARAPARPIAPDAGVLGGGPMGLMLAALLVAEGRTVTVADRIPSGARRPRCSGAMSAERLADHDVVFEAVGRPEAWRAAVQACARGGCVVLVGGCPGGSDARSRPACSTTTSRRPRRLPPHRAEVDRALRCSPSGAVDWRAFADEPIGLDGPRPRCPWLRPGAQAGGRQPGR